MQVELHQTDKFLYNKIMNQQSEQATYWMAKKKKKSAYHISDKRLISQICKKLIQLNSKKFLIIEKRTWIDIFLKNAGKQTRDTWKYNENYQSSWNCEWKPQKDTSSHLLEWLSVGEDAQERGTWCTVDGKLNWSIHLENIWSFLTQLELPYDPVIPILSLYLKEIKLLSQRDSCGLMFIPEYFTIAKI